MTDTELTRKENTRLEIIHAAYDLFLENGFHGTSMRQIARRSGFALGSIYNHFASKEEIFTTIFLQYHPYREVLSQLIDAQGETLETLLFDAARRLNQNIPRRSDDFLKLLFIEMVEFKAQHIPQFYQEVFPQVITLGILYFSQREEMRDLPLLINLRAFLGLIISHYVMEWLLGDQLPPEARNNTLDYFMAIYLHGVLKPEER